MAKRIRKRIGSKATRSGNLKLEVGTREVENPYFSADHSEGMTNPLKITAFINIRESAVETLFARGALDKAQKRAADRFRAIWEAVGGSGAGAMDYTREPVDGGGARDPISDRQILAGQELMACREMLGARGYALVCRVCGEGYALTEISSTKREKLTNADMLRAHLDDLATEWGYLRPAHLQRKAG